MKVCLCCVEPLSEYFLLSMKEEFSKKYEIRIFKENVENVKWFSENFPFEPESLHGLLPDGLGSDTLKQGYIQILPGEYGTDGFFIARFRRKQ